MILNVKVSQHARVPEHQKEKEKARTIKAKARKARASETLHLVDLVTTINLLVQPRMGHQMPHHVTTTYDISAREERIAIDGTLHCAHSLKKAIVLETRATSCILKVEREHLPRKQSQRRSQKSKLSRNPKRRPKESTPQH